MPAAQELEVQGGEACVSGRNGKRISAQFAAGWDSIVWTRPVRNSLIGQESRRFRRAQWLMLLATMFCYFFFYTGRQTFGFAIPGIEQELGISKATLGWASAALLWAYALGQFINGNLGDKFGGNWRMSGL